MRVRVAPAPGRGKRPSDSWPIRTTPFTDREYRQLYDFAPVNWMVLDGAAIILDISTTASHTLGSPARFLVGTPMRMWTDDDSRPMLIDHMRRCRDEAGPVETELTLRSRAGVPIAVRLYSRRFLFEGSPVYPTAAIDITDQKALERARRAAEADRDRAEVDRQNAKAAEAAKDRLIATVSHELRNPLSPALLAAVSLQQMPDLPDRARAMAAMIRRNIELEARLIDDLLDVARAERGQLDLRLSHVDAHEILRRAIGVCAPAAAAKSVVIAEDLGSPRRFVSADPGRLEQVFWNLINNGIKFSPRGGQLIVRSSCDDAGVLRVSVRDFGAGMDDKTIDMLFSPFDHPRAAAGSRSGLGLGLTIAKTIVDAHGGRIWASSEGAERGSLFEVELVTVAAPDAAPVTPWNGTPVSPVLQKSPRPDGSPLGRILIVEDHLEAGAALATCLEQRGYQVRLVTTLADGLRALDEPWDAVLSDIDLPDGSGLDIARRARHTQRTGVDRPRLVALSGFGMMSDIQRSRDAGFDTHLVKPVGADEVLRVLEQALVRS